MGEPEKSHSTFENQSTMKTGWNGMNQVLFKDEGQSIL